MNYENDPYQQRIRKALDEYGYCIVTTGSYTGEYNLAYTIGFQQTFQHPEIITFGLPSEVADRLLQHAAILIRENGSFKLQENIYTMTSNGLPVQFLEVHPGNIVPEYPVPITQLTGKDASLQVLWDMRPYEDAWRGAPGEAWTRKGAKSR